MNRIEALLDRALPYSNAGAAPVKDVTVPAEPMRPVLQTIMQRNHSRVDRTRAEEHRLKKVRPCSPMTRAKSTCSHRGTMRHAPKLAFQAIQTQRSAASPQEYLARQIPGTRFIFLSCLPFSTWSFSHISSTYARIKGASLEGRLQYLHSSRTSTAANKSPPPPRVIPQAPLRTSLTLNSTQLESTTKNHHKMPFFYSKHIGGRHFGTSVNADRHGVRRGPWRFSFKGLNCFK